MGKKNQCLFIDCQPNGFYDMNTKKKKRKFLGGKKKSEPGRFGVEISKGKEKRQTDTNSS